MKNLFDSANYPNQEPDELAIGSRWGWTRSDITSVYPTATYTLKYRFSLLTSAGTLIEITASKTASAHVVDVGTNVTSDHTAGDYSWQAVIVRDSDSEEVVVDTGFVTLLPDVGDCAVDTRSHNYKVLTAIRATIEGTATRDQMSYSIAGRSLSRRSMDELLKLKTHYETLWNNEVEAKRRKSGRKVSNRVLVKMSA